MTTPLSSFDQLSDHDLLREVARLAAREREATACLIASLASLDRRRLYLAEGHGSLFGYGTQALHLSEAAAYKRITVARAVQRFPMILDRLAEGTVSLATVSLLAAHLTVENHLALLDEVRHRSKREVEEVVARLQPRADVPSTVRRLPTPKSPPPPPPPPPTAAGRTTESPVMRADTTLVEPPPSPASTSSPATPDRTCSPIVDASAMADTRAAGAYCGQAANAHSGTVTPLAPARYKLTVTIGEETYEKLRAAQDLLRHIIPNGDLAVLLDRALTVLLREVAKTKLAATDTPRAGRALAPGSRHIPATVKRVVWERDSGQCAFVSSGGHRCAERGQLEFHHVVPYANGGDASVENLELRCKRHNAHEAERDFGPWSTAHVREARPVYASRSQAEAVNRRSGARPGASWPVHSRRPQHHLRDRERPLYRDRNAGHFSGSRVNARSRPAWRSTNPVALPAESIEKTSSVLADQKLVSWLEFRHLVIQRR
ncbi:MAG: hypothetical protein GEU99_02785 [Luteitalea sp.]|nr:hypothetical protein [Luteitalea sp.]